MPKSNCYKCEAEIEVSDLSVVHPLCVMCETDFDLWFAKQLEGRNV